MRDMVCQSGVELLVDYMEGLLADEVREALDAHVAGCPRCQAFIASYAATPRILRDATDAALPAEIHARLHAFLRAQREKPE